MQLQRMIIQRLRADQLTPYWIARKYKEILVSPLLIGEMELNRV
jgi:hypothetical protein